MISEKWNQMSKYQRFGNISSEICRSIQYLELESMANYESSMYRVLDMIDYNKNVDKNIELFRFYEHIAGLIFEPDLDELKSCFQYTMTLMNVPLIKN